MEYKTGEFYFINNNLKTICKGNKKYVKLNCNPSSCNSTDFELKNGELKYIGFSKLKANVYIDISLDEKHSYGVFVNRVLQNSLSFSVEPGDVIYVGILCHNLNCTGYVVKNCLFQLIKLQV